MTQWWPSAFPSPTYPDNEWFWALRPGTTDTYSPYTEWAAGHYWFYKIPADANHKKQLAFKSPVDRRSESWGQRLVKANVVYIITYDGDTPNWGGASSLVEIGPPCGNWRSDMYEVVPIPDIINIRGKKTDHLSGLPLSGWAITLRNSAGDTQQVTTDANGDYAFLGLSRDVYSVYETIQDGWVCDVPDAGGRYDGITSAEGSGTVEFERNFENHLPLINIRGRKTNSETGEPLSGWTITVEDSGGSLSGTRHALTDENGYYEFLHLPLDTYSVYETIQDGWTCVTPDATGRYDGITAPEESGITEIERNFANYHPEPPPPPIPDIINISGKKTDHLSGLPLSGWAITLRNSAGDTQQVTTDANGDYAFLGLSRDVYSVYETIQDGWVCDVPDAGGRYDGITSAEGSGTVDFVRNFENHLPLINIRGRKTNGLTGAVLPGWTISLANGSGLISQVQTDLSGDYAFLGLPRDVYSVYETLVVGWVCNTPGPGCRYDGITIAEEAGTVDFVRNFVNSLLPIQRSQTYGNMAAIRADREMSQLIRAAIASTQESPISIYAAIRTEIDLPIEIMAAVRTDREKSLPIRAAIRTERTLEPGIVSAVAKTFDVPIGQLAAIRGNTQAIGRIRAAILGETEKTVGIVAYVVKSRVDKILLDFEPMFPQEFDQRSVRNAASKAKDWRKDTLGE